ncbi:hypothetical protein LDVICp192 [lymphocystis disease virus-China]|uniref:Uncharacterized protein n=1 Tax=lymphocystis disease virus-China TaxID=256729 RepID=Q677S2_9VIRU|nr:hypothetical protein LDVICp192 [lymphocystis disease virus-China]AAU11035.1 hypothetical protein [lymphocystis disease virus-China]
MVLSNDLDQKILQLLYYNQLPFYHEVENLHVIKHNVFCFQVRNI